MKTVFLLSNIHTYVILYRFNFILYLLELQLYIIYLTNRPNIITYIVFTWDALFTVLCARVFGNWTVQVYNSKCLQFSFSILWCLKSTFTENRIVMNLEKILFAYIILIVETYIIVKCEYLIPILRLYPLKKWNAIFNQR